MQLREAHFHVAFCAYRMIPGFFSKTGIQTIYCEQSQYNITKHSPTHTHTHPGWGGRGGGESRGRKELVGGLIYWHLLWHGAHNCKNIPRWSGASDCQLCGGETPPGRGKIQRTSSDPVSEGAVLKTLRPFLTRPPTKSKERVKTGIKRLKKRLPMCIYICLAWRKEEFEGTQL